MRACRSGSQDKQRHATARPAMCRMGKNQCGGCLLHAGRRVGRTLHASRGASRTRAGRFLGRRRPAAAGVARARRTRAASGSSTRSTRRRRWSAPRRSGSPPASCSCSSPIRATARRSPSASASPLHVLPDVLPDSPFSVLEPRPRPVEGARAVVAGAEGARGRRVDRHRDPLRRRARPRRHPLPAPSGAADAPEAVPARAPAGRPRRRLFMGATRRRRCSTRSTARAASFRCSS